MDNGTPAHESLRLLSVVLVDEDDNAPHFALKRYQFTVRENLAPGIIIGKCFNRNFVPHSMFLLQSNKKSGILLRALVIPIRQRNDINARAIGYVN